MKRIKRINSGKMKFSAFLVGGMLALGGGCVPDNFWMTQLNNTLTTAVNTVVGSTIVPAIGTALGS